MKRRLLTLAMILTMALGTVNASAAELDDTAAKPEKQEFSIDVFEEKLDEKVAIMNEKYNTRVTERTAKFNERIAKSEERSALRMEVVAEYAPELVVDFEGVYAAHIIVHEALFNEHMLNSSEFVAETNAGLATLKDEVLASIEAGTMTGQEARAEIKAYMAGRREEYKATKEAYKAEIADLDAANELSKEEAKALKTELKAALEAEDATTIVSVLNQLLDLANTHVEYDYAKLAILETY